MNTYDKRAFVVLMSLVTISSLSVYGSAQPSDDDIISPIIKKNSITSPEQHSAERRGTRESIFSNRRNPLNYFFEIRFSKRSWPDRSAMPGAKEEALQYGFIAGEDKTGRREQVPSPGEFLDPPPKTQVALVGAAFPGRGDPDWRILVGFSA